MIKYCNRCKHHIPYLAELNKDDGKEDGHNICAASMKVKINPIGEEYFAFSGKAEFCPRCGQVTHDDREVIFTKCHLKNQSFKCKSFEPTFFWRLLSKLFYRGNK